LAKLERDIVMGVARSGLIAIKWKLKEIAIR
jgi:hypothetical protein